MTSNLTALSLSDATTWPMRMTKHETAYVLRRSRRSLDDLIAQGRFPKPDDGRTWAREVVIEYAKGKAKEYERAAAEHARRGRIAMVGGTR